ncbi:MAG: chorismate synthase [Ignisphaera sp.]
MPGNSFGRFFKITTFGESHGPAVGVVIDGVPAGLPISIDDIEIELRLRRPGKAFTSPRREVDRVEIISGIFNGRTTGAPITVIVRNIDVDSSYYEEIKYTPRPNHADIPYIIKYGYENWDYRGGGRASGRETVARVIAGALAKKLLMLSNTLVLGCIKSIGPISTEDNISFNDLVHARCSPLRACKPEAESKFAEVLRNAINDGDSYGGVVEVHVLNPPMGLCEPVFDKIKADLAKSVMSIPGVTGFEYGLGFNYAKKRGSEVADEVFIENGRIRWRYNYAGGILGGITTGEEIVIRCAFKPTSSIRFPQKTVDIRSFEEKTISIRGRHDPCIAIRGVAVVEAMVAITLVDHSIRANVIPAVRLSDKDVETIQERWERYKSLCKPSEEYQ